MGKKVDSINRLKELGSLALISTALLGCGNDLEVAFLDNPVFNTQEAERLNSAQLVNEQEIIEGILLTKDGTTSTNFNLANPYSPAKGLTTEECNNSENCTYSQDTLNANSSEFPARSSVYDWWTIKDTLPETAQVCGVKFLDADTYRLDTFDDIDTLRAADGYALTHYLACGACSTLQDLAVYGTLDLTVMAKACTKKGSMDAKKACMQEIGFSESCSEVWSYNGRNTAEVCPIECIKTYGLFRLVLGIENAPEVDENGELNQCLMCDEMMSGPGFQYGSGRTRRNSGISSEILRPEDQVYNVVHDYF